MVYGAGVEITARRRPWHNEGDQEMSPQEPKEELPPPRDKATLKSAMRAFRKRLKMTRLDDESRLGGSSMSSGKESAIAFIEPPNQFPKETWDELAKQGRLAKSNSGLFGLND